MHLLKKSEAVTGSRLQRLLAELVQPASTGSDVTVIPRPSRSISESILVRVGPRPSRSESSHQSDSANAGRPPAGGADSDGPSRKSQPAAAGATAERAAAKRTARAAARLLRRQRPAGEAAREAIVSARSAAALSWRGVDLSQSNGQMI